MILPQYDGNCGWYEMLGKVSDFPALEQDLRVDAVVIGGGFVGCAAARRLAENQPEGRFLLIEALKIGQGASGRNSGFVIDQPHKRDLESNDNELKRKLVRLNRAAVDYLETQIERYGIDCQWSHAGKYQAAVGARGEKFLDHYEQLLKNFGEQYERLSPQRLRDVFGTEFYSAAIFTPGGALMQPAALMRGLADSMPENVRIAEHTPVTEITRTAGGFVLKTPKARIECRQLVLGTNIFTAELGFLRDRILPVMTFASMTRPLTDEQMKRYGGELDWGLTPADHAGTTVRMTQDRRLIIRNSYRYAHDYNTPQDLLPTMRARHREAFDARYPQLGAVAFEYTWAAPAACPATSKPISVSSRTASSPPPATRASVPPAAPSPA
ncbi:NAD(P)/FAD-dependent oxidoreductase [Marinobacterium aestuariivivens]|uniref:NAD(P)/FAD-dependent oxidoreductase n=1 Tax=Marinobacterium aestuariivivens TaxID=1698799 RepID=A0ABW1ZTP1_9GAMM